MPLMNEKKKKWELTLVHRNENDAFNAHSINQIEDDDIIGLLAQFQMVLALTLRHEHDQIIKELTLSDDDIPF